MCTHKLAEKKKIYIYIYLARVLSRPLIHKLATDKIGLFICCKANETSLSDGQTITSNIKSFSCFPISFLCLLCYFHSVVIKLFFLIVNSWLHHIIIYNQYYI